MPQRSWSDDRVTDDHLSQLVDPNCPTIIMVPGYGQTASDYMALSYYLAQHRFRVLRYDPTNHLGIARATQQTTLRSMQHDLERSWGLYDTPGRKRRSS
jgi:hypothetical protein